MANLRYKTKGNVSPKGKARVYFCCHPEDFEKYFESISEEILAKQSCVIWYDADFEGKHDEMSLSDLLQMQLFVMPVTTNLLCIENRALNVEFKFAMENHIPVLPLMQEPGLEKLFNQKCGELQFLEKSNTDSTAISYDEKLEKYLSAVLIGDELAEKIRAAFDAYVFLSYRKKDRGYAQQLMKLIHKNEFCQDIAIWYDEFLTPGENFNDSIKEALQKSDLFVMAVTPNLVNESNYIMTTEYPMARQEGKQILPAELLPTDKNLLSEKYEDIPHCADAYNEKELSEMLLQSIKKMAIKKDNASPEHNFFVGLAYLGGIDVEVDHEKAVSLIQSAAESGLEEAIEKVIHMYTNGVAVSCDFSQVIFWQKKLIECLTEKIKTDVSGELLRNLELTVLRYSSNLENMGRIQDSLIIREEFIHTLEACAKEHDSEEIQIKLAEAYDDLSGFYDRKVGNKTYAASYYMKALDIWLSLDYKLMQGTKLSYSLDFSKLREYCETERKKDYTEKIIEQVETILAEAECAHKNPNSDISKKDIAYFYSSIGRIYENLNILDKADEMYDKSLNIMKEFAERSDDVFELEDWAVMIAGRSFFKKEIGQKETAKQFINEAAKIYQNIIEMLKNMPDSDKNVDCLNNIAYFYKKTADLCRLQDDEKKGFEFEKLRCSIMEKAVEIAPTAENYEALQRCYSSMEFRGKDVSLDENEIEQFRMKSLECLEKIYLIQEEKLVNSNMRYYDVSNLAYITDDIASVYFRLGNIKKAIEYYKRNLAIKEKIFEMSKDASVLYHSYYKIADMYSFDSEYLSAYEYYIKGFELEEKILQENPTPRNKEHLVYMKEKIGEEAFRAGKLKEGYKYYWDALAQRILIMNEYKEDKYIKDVYFALAGLIRKSERYEINQQLIPMLRQRMEQIEEKRPEII